MISVAYTEYKVRKAESEEITLIYVYVIRLGRGESTHICTDSTYSDGDSANRSRALYTFENPDPNMSAILELCCFCMHQGPDRTGFAVTAA